MPGRPPTRRAHRAEQGATQQTVLHGRRTNLPTVVPSRGLPKPRRPNQGLPKHRRRNRRNKRHRLTASSSCLLPVGGVARRDGGGGRRARELHASNFAEIERRRLQSQPAPSQFLQLCLDLVDWPASFGLRRVPLATSRTMSKSATAQSIVHGPIGARCPSTGRWSFRFDLIGLSVDDLPTRLLESSPVARSYSLPELIALPINRVL